MRIEALHVERVDPVTALDICDSARSRWRGVIRNVETTVVIALVVLDVRLPLRGDAVGRDRSVEVTESLCGLAIQEAVHRRLEDPIMPRISSRFGLRRHALPFGTKGNVHGVRAGDERHVPHEGDACALHECPSGYVGRLARQCRISKGVTNACGAPEP